MARSPRGMHGTVHGCLIIWNAAPHNFAPLLAQSDGIPTTTRGVKKSANKIEKKKEKKDDIMDGRAMVEFLWAIVVVFLQVFRIVPNAADANDGDEGTALSGSTFIADPPNATVSSLIINTTTVAPSVAPAVVSTAKPSVAPIATPAPTRGPAIITRVPIVVAAAVPTPTMAMAVTLATTKTTGAPAVIAPPPVAQPTSTSSAAPMKKALAPVRTPVATAAPATPPSSPPQERNSGTFENTTTTTFIESFVLVYAPTNTELFELHDGDVIDQTTLSGGDGVIKSLAFNVKVNVKAIVGAVSFAETGRREGSGKAWNDVHAFDGQSWSKWASLNVGRHGSGLAVDCFCGNQIIIASGAAGQGGGPEITSVEIYFPDGPEKQSCNA